jgi:penicillin-binding protein 1B
LAKGFWTSRAGLFLLGSFLFLFLLATGVFAFYWVRFSRMIDEQLGGGAFARASRVYAAPRQIAVGETLTPAGLVAYLQRTGYTELDADGAAGTYRASGARVEIRPGPDSYLAGQGAVRVEFSGREISRIVRLDRREEVASAELEPELLTNLFDSSREKRRLVRFEDLPGVLVDAVLAAEDKRFFKHPGFDPIRILGAAWNNLRRSDRTEGASTISMQVARSYFFTTERTWRRKLAETLVALQLEQRFSKEKIFELYANQVYLGNRGSFAIRGFGEAAQAYFAKDVRELTLAEAAFLAGIARSPNRYSSSERHLDRASEARDRVLAQLVEDNRISPEAAGAAKKAQWRIARGTLETSSAPYLVDMVKDYLLERFSEAELISQSYRIYTTLDLDLQRAAAQAVEAGVHSLDAQLARQYQRWKTRSAKTGESVPRAQVALVALDARTGEIRALIGGRDYGESQLNRALARRQPGSAFKPFVYAAAINTGREGHDPALTTISTVVDEPTTFLFDGREYAPSNYGEDFRGTVSLREALTRSLNVATVKVAEAVGYAQVVNFARQLGMGARIQPTPALALGAYEMTPVEVASAYTIFASGGSRAEPYFLRSVTSASGITLERKSPAVRQVMDPGVAFITTTMLEDVVNRGTAAGVRARGFAPPAGGKTGTSHDGWFAGFTSNLVCVVWVGFDDNRELGLSGASSAAPIWADVMKRAVMLPAYAGAHDFTVPPGVVVATIDPETLQTATASCPVTREEYFLEGTEPKQACLRHGGQLLTRVPPGMWLSGVFGGKPAPPAAPSGEQADAAAGERNESNAASDSADKRAKTGAQPAKSSQARPPSMSDDSSAAQDASQSSPGFFRRLFSIFSGKKKQEQQKPPAKQEKKPAKSNGKSPRN